MPFRRTTFVNDHFYHIFNRCDFGESFISLTTEYNQIINSIKYYQNETHLRYSRFKQLDQKHHDMFTQINSNKKIEFLAFTIMPNHYHFLIKQLIDNGISDFISHFQLSLAKYLNTKYELRGSLFPSRFKSVFVGGYELLLHISRYIHLNPVTAYLINFDQLINYPYTSFSYYAKNINDDFINTSYVLNEKFSPENYVKFVYDNVDYQRKLKYIEKLTLD